MAWQGGYRTRMSDILFWHNSEVLQVTPPGAAGQAARITLTAAAVERAGLSGFLKPLELVFVQAQLTGPVSDCIGSISEGACRLGSGVSRQLPLPWVSEGPVQLSLQFRNGSTLLIEAASAHCVPTADTRFIESYAC